MKCQDYVFELTSGRLQEAGWLTKVGATSHYLMCRSCRGFSKNDEMILNAVRAHRQQCIEDMQPFENLSGVE